MTKWPIVRRHLSRVARAIAFMFAGAVVLDAYLQWNDLVLDRSWGRLGDTLFYLGLIFFVVAGALEPDQDRGRLGSGKLSPDYSGGSAILLTGVTAAVILWAQQSGDKDYLVPGLILLASVVGSIVAWRFARIHKAEIGEARFKS